MGWDEMTRAGMAVTRCLVDKVYIEVILLELRGLF